MGFDQYVLRTVRGEILGIILLTWTNIMYTTTTILIQNATVARFGTFASYKFMIASKPQSAGIPCILPERHSMHTPVVIFVQYSTRPYGLATAA